MEIIPILTVTILAVTILTLILSIFAYIFYKLRERRNGNHRAFNNGGQKVALQKEVLVIPQRAEKEPAMASAPKAPVFAPVVTAPEGEEPLFWRYTPNGYVPVTKREKVGELKWR